MFCVCVNNTEIVVDEEAPQADRGKSGSLPAYDERQPYSDQEKTV